MSVSCLTERKSVCVVCCERERESDREMEERAYMSCIGHVCQHLHYVNSMSILMKEVND